MQRASIDVAASRMDSLQGYDPVDVESKNATCADSHKGHAALIDKDSMSMWSRGANRGRRLACFAATFTASAGLLWAVAHSFNRTSTVADHLVDFDEVSDHVIKVTRAKATAPDGYTEWTVVNPIVKVRSANSLTGSIIGSKDKGAIVIGEQKGTWLKLAQEKGWMIIVMGKGHQMLQSRKVHYYRVEDGSCNDMGAFPITDKSACVTAAGYLGYKTSLDDIEIYKGKACLPDGCYAAGNRITLVPAQANFGDDNCKPPDSWKSICSSGAYPRWFSGDGYVDSKAISARVAINAKHVAEKFKACPAPTECTLLWPVSINDFVRIGFGASIGWFSPVRAYYAVTGCKIAVGTGFASHWKGTGFAPFWNEEIPDSTFQARWKQGADCGGMYWTTHFKPTLIKCEMPKGFVSDAKLEAFLKTPQYNGRLFDGWYSLYLQSFGPRLAAYRLPFDHTFAAFHVRKGDKQEEIRTGGNQGMFEKSGNVQSLLAVMNKYWPHITSVFIATDDSNTVKEAANAVKGKYNITWSANAARYPGGSPMAQFENHASNDGAVNGVLDDQAGLAIASVLIGGSDSGFFNVAHALNQVLHKGMPRKHPWCFDIYKNTICD